MAAGCFWFRPCCPAGQRPWLEKLPIKMTKDKKKALDDKKQRLGKEMVKVTVSKASGSVSVLLD